MNIKPTVGRVVYYKSRGSADGVFPPADRAAIITDVFLREEGEPLGNEVRLCVFNPEGLFFTSWLTQGQAPGQWDWMPFQKDQQMRLFNNENKTMNEENTRGAANPDESAPAVETTEEVVEDEEVTI